MSDLVSRADLAQRLGISEKTLRRHLPSVPNLSCIKIGRTIYFTEADVGQIQKALRCPYPTASAVIIGTSAGRSASVVKLSPSKKSIQDAVQEQMLKLLERPKKPVSGASASTARV
ncbi:hypothetical protein [Gluconacetobacter asukensis]|uniref:Helix-turn-helix domain-containing protein n=1 Tax=Gluconacetobacter asukensis TaxID=1017181 RepID=A0A7W4J1E5_9PROT|nr:hypothetical protein [Gluconacetobacter asukensis]MBB2172834.1 hypothetical protein [Gluconacetobacter asukensis]